MVKYMTAGESHGMGLTIIVEGFPAGVPLSEDGIQEDLARRQRGYGRGGRQLIEKDRAQLLAGVRHGVTMGSPISMWIENKDFANWHKVMSTVPVDEPGNTVTRLRAGHADMPGTIKYGQSDVRNILERASARETAARVAAGSVAKHFLREFGIEVHSHIISIGGVRANYEHPVDWARVIESPVQCVDPEAEAEMIKVIDKAKEDGDTVGGMIEVVATGVPIGLGAHVHYERSDVCNAPPAGVIGEAAVAFVLADAFLEKFGGDHIEETRRNFNAYQRTIGPRSWEAVDA